MIAKKVFAGALCGALCELAASASLLRHGPLLMWSQHSCVTGSVRT